MSGVISHVSVGVRDVDVAAAFYDNVLATLAIKRIKPVLVDNKLVALGYGQYWPQFWIGLPDNGRAASAGNGAHFAFSAKSPAQVDEFYRVAMAHGATDAGAPGPRPQYVPSYYGAFVIDPDGNKIEASFVDIGIWAWCNIQ
jgi:catechol 2,3-dioxygenase-like lactoylglutathione lyase family enzyme